MYKYRLGFYSIPVVIISSCNFVWLHIFFVVWESDCCPLLGCTRSQGRCWAAIRSSHHPEPSDRWIGHRRTTWSTVCPSAPHSQAAEEAIPHLCKQEQKRTTPVQRWSSRTHTVLGRVSAGADSRKAVQPLRLPLMIHPMCRTYVVVVRWTDELLCGKHKRVSQFKTPSICAGRPVSTEWSRCPGSMAWCDIDSVAPLQRNSAGRMPARIGRLSAGVGRRHPVTIRCWWRGR